MRYLILLFLSFPAYADVVVYHKPMLLNAGESYSVNGCRFSNGEYVVFLDGDLVATTWNASGTTRYHAEAGVYEIVYDEGYLLAQIVSQSIRERGPYIITRLAGLPEGAERAACN